MTKRLANALHRVITAMQNDINETGNFIESWPGIALGWALAALLVWARWPLVEVMQ